MISISLLTQPRNLELRSNQKAALGFNNERAHFDPNAGTAPASPVEHVGEKAEAGQDLANPFEVTGVVWHGAHGSNVRREGGKVSNNARGVIQ